SAHLRVHRSPLRNRYSHSAIATRSLALGGNHVGKISVRAALPFNSPGLSLNGLRLAPGPGPQGLRRDFAQGEAKRQGAAQPAPVRSVEAPHALGPAEGANLRTLPEDLGYARQLQQIALHEIEEEQPRARVDHQIAQSVEVAVAAEIRNQQRAVG